MNKIKQYTIQSTYKFPLYIDTVGNNTSKDIVNLNPMQSLKAQMSESRVSKLRADFKGKIIIKEDKC